MSSPRLARSINRLSAILSTIDRKVAARHDISASQLRILLALHGHGEQGAKISTLANEQSLAVSTMTRNLALLQKRGWVQRRTGEQDRRTVWVALTDAGTALATAVDGTIDRTYRRAFSGFHAVDLLERAVAIERVATALESSSAREP